MSDSLGLGKIITTEKHRDAVHIAVAPVVASERLHPGERIGFVADGGMLVEGVPDAAAIGIVDPFLRSAVAKDQRFWMYLNPGSITSLRHDWTHPALPNIQQVISGECNYAGAAIVDEKQVAINWMKNAAIQLGVTYEELIEDDCDLVTGDYINNGETIRDRWRELADDFWKHHKVITGKETPEYDRGGFTCSC